MIDEELIDSLFIRLRAMEKQMVNISNSVAKMTAAIEAFAVANEGLLAEQINVPVVKFSNKSPSANVRNRKNGIPRK
jgi:2-methylaconitate cis-trans-isomerase PrpF